MCGIFGLVLSNDSTISKREDFDKSLRLLFKLSELRGREAAGLAIFANKAISIYKEGIRPAVMLKDSGFAEFITSSSSGAHRQDAEAVAKPLAAIGHCRLVTNGSQAITDNNQPIHVGHIVGIHNGIITNEEELLRLHPEAKPEHRRDSDSDSELLFGLINGFYEKDGDLLMAIAKTYKEISGSASLALLSDDFPALALATNTGSLYYSRRAGGGLFVFGSERYIIQEFLRRCKLPGMADLEIINVRPSQCVLIPLDTVEPQVVSFREVLEGAYATGKRDAREPCTVLVPSRLSKALRRCNKCVLPETYPFITFDADGVCNYCRTFQKQAFHGRAALERILEKYRSPNGDPDCLVAFSGGRDSSYGLHVIKTELGMNPIAYTYDWGMVTDQARRNQARLCGKLGVEHIIRAADIPKKRRYIRKNIYAWLKKPELGMVPIFMAGDKMFYYYGRQLRKQTGIRLTIFCAGQQVEQMEFKVGFCGINQTLINNTRLYHYDALVKLRLAMWYVKQYLLNPSYINESLLDCIFAFHSSFLNKDDYLYLYHYIPWDEKLIERTLREQYGWESDTLYGTNQWRMGDGHTAFIDYIYYTVAGFSEFDNFRCHQIREGLLTREEALELLEEDNKVRIQSLRNFAELVGFNLEEVLMKINAIPKLYAPS